MVLAQDVSRGSGQVDPERSASRAYSCGFDWRPQLLTMWLESLSLKQAISERTGGRSRIPQMSPVTRGGHMGSFHWSAAHRQHLWVFSWAAQSPQRGTSLLGGHKPGSQVSELRWIKAWR